MRYLLHFPPAAFGRQCVGPLLCFALVACAAGERRFPLRDPLWRDSDLLPVRARCRTAPSSSDPYHVSCAPEPYDSPLIWNGADNLFFRPLSELTGVVTSGESANVNSFDEVPDSAWFTNRIGVRPMSVEELSRNACTENQFLDPDHTPDGAWVIDKGKTSGSTPGFRINVPGKGKYLVKVEALGLPERQVAATVIGEAVYYGAGYNASCEQALYVRPSIFKLTPGLRWREGNFGRDVAFNQKVLDSLFERSNKHDGLLRISASAWIPGYVIGQFRYEGTRSDDPNDVIPHENRRELRGARLLAAWIDHFDSREGNSLDTWIAEGQQASDTSPGHVVHYQIGTSAALGSVWDWDPISRRLGYSYVVDWHDMGMDFVTLGAKLHVWDTIEKVPGQEKFGYFNVVDFDPEKWKNESPNPAFSRMTERDGAWMARILARFTPEMVRTLTVMAKFKDPADTEYLESVLEGRLNKILDRYLTRLSPLTEVHLEGRDTLCGVNLAEWRGIRDPGTFRYSTRLVGGPWVTVERRPGAQVCATLPHIASDGGVPDAAPERYVRVRVEDGVAEGPLIAHLYDLGPARGYRLVGLERPGP